MFSEAPVQTECANPGQIEVHVLGLTMLMLV